ncbi:MAG TPA: hypothetical protein VLA71_14940 [Algoriphagus sp.]|nr:hypothetical protein [Algoriphagus sp.]
MKSNTKKPIYKLDKIEEKIKDYSFLLNGTWTIKSIKATPNPEGGTVSFRSNDRSFRISSKCTAVRIRIGAMDESNFSHADEFFELYDGSKICFGDNMPSITGAFRLTKKYQLNNGQTLILMDSIGNEVLELHR